VLIASRRTKRKEESQRAESSPSLKREQKALAGSQPIRSEQPQSLLRRLVLNSHRTRPVFSSRRSSSPQRRIKHHVRALPFFFSSSPLIAPLQIERVVLTFDISASTRVVGQDVEKAEKVSAKVVPNDTERSSVPISPSSAALSKLTIFVTVPLRLFCIRGRHSSVTTSKVSPSPLSAVSPVVVASSVFLA
jgi:hypothetical protein